MTVMPGLRGVYDGWNRLVEARNASNVLIAKYDYNGLNHRVRRAVGNVVTTSFFNRNWQELESTTASQTTVNVWGLRYIDDLVLRERGNERLYSLADPNWNVVATVNAAGVVQERMRYDAFGRITWLNAVFAVKGNSDFAWNRAFTGQVLDSETGMMLYRNRVYHAGLGRFVQRDPIGYRGRDVSLYRYVFNAPQFLADAFGLRSGVLCKHKACCEEARKGRSVHGTVACCDGKPIMCLYSIEAPGTSPYANAAKWACMILHESVHVYHTECDPNAEGFSEPRPNRDTIPPFPPSDLDLFDPHRPLWGDRSECAAYQASEQCLAIAKQGCFGNQDCEEQIEAERRRHAWFSNYHCYPENRPRGLDNLDHIA